MLFQFQKKTEPFWITTPIKIKTNKFGRWVTKFWLRSIYALSFYVTKTVLVGPKCFWSDQIDLDLTIMIWSRPKWNGHDQNELVRSKLWFAKVKNHNLDLTNSFWSWPFHFGRDQINLVRPKPFWTNQNCFGHIEG